MVTAKNGWSLHRKGPKDQARHQKKVEDAIRQNLADLISNETIITSDGKSIVRVPVRSMKEYCFRFNPYKSNHVGQGGGKTRVGDVLAKGRQKPGAEQAGQAGQGEGDDHYEAEVSVDHIQEILFQDLELPRLRRTTDAETEQSSVRFNTIRKKGIFSNLDKRRSVFENIRRNARKGKPYYGDLIDDDLRFRSWKQKTLHEQRAVVVLMRDVSGSMGEFKKLMTRTVVFWMLRFLRTRYEKVHVVFITHHIHAREVSEKEFFHLGESGGTRVSSAYALALDIIDQRYPPSGWNVYNFHFSDGDNWGDVDNQLCIELARELLKRSNLFGYVEINEGGYVSPLMGALQQVNDDEYFMAVHLRKSEDVLKALKTFFHKGAVGRHAG